jgi:hypothetical protein
MERGGGALAALAEAERVVARDLQCERDPLAVLRTLKQRRVGPDLARPRVQPRHRLAVQPQRRLAAGREQQVDARSRPVGRNDGGPAQPVGGEQRAEPLARDRRPVLEAPSVLV